MEGCISVEALKDTVKRDRCWTYLTDANHTTSCDQTSPVLIIFTSSFEMPCHLTVFGSWENLLRPSCACCTPAGHYCAPSNICMEQSPSW